MALAIALGCIFLGVLVTGLRIMMAINRYEEICRDSEWD